MPVWWLDKRKAQENQQRAFWRKKTASTEKKQKKQKQQSKDADQLQEKYKSLLLSWKNALNYGATRVRTGKINFDLQNTELSKLEPKLQKYYNCKQKNRRIKSRRRSQKGNKRSW